MRCVCASKRSNSSMRLLTDVGRHAGLPSAAAELCCCFQRCYASAGHSDQIVHLLGAVDICCHVVLAHAICVAAGGADGVCAATFWLQSGPDLLLTAHVHCLRPQLMPKHSSLLWLPLMKAEHMSFVCVAGLASGNVLLSRHHWGLRTSAELQQLLMLQVTRHFL